MRGAVTLPRSWYARESLDVAPDLLGKVLVRHDLGVAARIVETEAYLSHDPACHAHRGLTPGNAVLFGPPGHAYVYFTYGMHWMLNTVTGADGDGQGVLLRAAEPLEGVEAMRARRGAAVGDRDLLRGPARLAQAFGIDRGWKGADLVASAALLTVLDDGWRPPTVTAGPRVGVRQAADLPWRFHVRDNPWVSGYKRHPRAGGPHPAG